MLAHLRDRRLFQEVILHLTHVQHHKRQAPSERVQPVRQAVGRRRLPEGLQTHQTMLKQEISALVVVSALIVRGRENRYHLREL